MEVSDLNIIKIYKRNKHQGLELLYERYKKYVYTIAFRYAGSKEDALDITQEVFVSLFRNMDKFKEEFSILPWIKKITVNRCLNFIRDKKETLSLNKITEEGDEFEAILPSDENTERSILYKDTKKSLETAIKRLPPEERMAVLLRHMKGMKYEEIARVMNVPLGTIKTFLHRGRKILKDDLGKIGIWEV